MLCPGVLLTGFPAAYWFGASSEGHVIALQGERYVMIGGDNAARLPPAHYRLAGGNYLINGDISVAVHWLCAATSPVHKVQSGVQKSLSTMEVFSSRSLGLINEKINKVTRGTEPLVCAFSLPNQNKTRKNNLKDMMLFIEEIITESLIRIRKPAISFVAL